MRNAILPTVFGFALTLSVGWPIAANEIPNTEDDEKTEQAQQPETIKSTGKRDDWVLSLTALKERRRIQRRQSPSLSMPSPVMSFRPAPTAGAQPAQASRAMAKSALGLSVGGAKDINNFRQNIENGYLPLPTDVTPEGLFYDYFFDTGKPAAKCQQLFCPSYNLAVSPDPLSGKPEYYMAVGLQSNLRADTFRRKKLNLVVVLDISGSMNSPFNRYHYDRKGGKKKRPASDARSKMQVANEAVQNLTQHLRDDDRFAMVVFNNQAHLAKPLNPVGQTDMDKIRGHIGKLPAGGGTNFSAGYKMGAQLLAEHKSGPANEYENRVIFLTDAMPNRGQLSEDGLFGMTEKNARRQIHTTFVGIGVDFNSTLIETISKVRGANYFSAHSGKAFNDLLDKDFEYIVTPMVFDLSLKLLADGVTIDKVYGSPQADLTTGQVMRVSTLFPSRTSDEAVKGGLVLLKLSGEPAQGSMSLTASYETRDGSRHSDQQQVIWAPTAQPWFSSTGIRKGIVLARYSNLLTHWMLEEGAQVVGKDNRSGGSQPDNSEELVYAPCALASMPTRGICLPPRKLGRYERRSRKLSVNSKSAQTLKTFLGYLQSEADALADKTLNQESTLIKQLLAVAKGQDGPTGEQGKRDDWKLR